MKFDAIILGGGTSSRMKLESHVPKQLQKVYKGESLLHYQAKWLKSHGVENVVMAINENTFEYITQHEPAVLKLGHMSIEAEKRGTAGAVLNAVEFIKSPAVYVMNVDDFLLSDVYKPHDLIDTLDRGYKCSILTSRGRFSYGVLRSRGWRITSFEQKPLMDYKVSAGHHAFTTSYIKDFPEYGNYEDIVFPTSVKKREVTFLDLDGTWITANTWKELKQARISIRDWKDRAVYGTSKRPAGFKGYGIS